MVNFEYTSPTFTTMAQMEKEKKILHEKLAAAVGVSREEFRLQQGLITLSMNSNDYWLPYTSIIGEFKEKIRNNKGKEFKLSTKVQFKLNET